MAKPNKKLPAIESLPIDSLPAEGQKSIKYAILNLEHGEYAVGKIPHINTEALTTNEVNYLVSIGWKHIRIVE